jgi:ankyrin repeat protein
MKWVTRLNESGGLAVQYDPVHAALPWAGVRFATGGCAETARTLLEYRTRIDMRNWSGATQLHDELRQGHDKVVRMLLENGVDIEARNDEGEGTLHLATPCPNTRVVQMPLKYGAKVGSKDKHGDTALHIATFCGQEGTIQL